MHFGGRGLIDNFRFVSLQTFPLKNLCFLPYFSTHPGPRGMTTLSFANIISAAKAVEAPAMQNANGLGKKGKKPTKVLLSTAGGRRY